MFHKMYKKSQILWWIRIERESWAKYKVKQNSDKARGSVIASEFCFFQPRYSIRCNCIKYILYYIVLHSITLYVISPYCTILLHESFLPLNKKQADFPWEFATNDAESPFLTGSLCPLTWLDVPKFQNFASPLIYIIMNGVIITLIITMIMMATIKMTIMTMTMTTTYDDHQVHPDQASRRRSWAPTWLPPWRRQWLTLDPVTKTHTGVFCQYMHVLIQC